METVIFMNSYLVSGSMNIDSSSKFDPTSQVPGSEIYVPTESLLSFDQETTFQEGGTSESKVVLKDTTSQAFKVTGKLEVSDLLLVSRPGFEQSLHTFLESVPHAITPCYIQTKPFHRDEEAQSTSATTWVIIGVMSFLFLAAVITGVIWFVLFRRRNSSSSEEPAVTPELQSTTVTIEEIEEEFEGLNPLASSGDDALFLPDDDEPATFEQEQKGE
jgi:hypothetical protein